MEWLNRAVDELYDNRLQNIEEVQLTPWRDRPPWIAISNGVYGNPTTVPAAIETEIDRLLSKYYERFGRNAPEAIWKNVARSVIEKHLKRHAETAEG